MQDTSLRIRILSHWSILTTALLLLMPNAATAGALNWSVDVPLSLPTLSFVTIVTVLSGSEADSFVVANESITVDVASGDSFSVTTSSGSFALSSTTNTVLTCATVASPLILTVSGPVDDLVIRPASITCSPDGGSGRRGSAVLEQVPPTAPKNVAVTASKASVTLTWIDATDADLRDVVLYRGVAPLPVSAEPFAVVPKGVQRYVDTAVRSGGAYAYILRSRDVIGNIDTNSVQYEATVIASADENSASGSGAGMSAVSSTPSSGSGSTMTPGVSSVVGVGGKALEAGSATVDAMRQSAESPAPLPPTEMQLDPLYKEALDIFTKSVDEIAHRIARSRDGALEQMYSALVTRVVSESVTAETRQRVTAFVAYGTPSTQVHGAGQRAASVHSFRAAFERDPGSLNDWYDILKLANGRFSNQTNDAREIAVASTFAKVYKRKPNRSNVNDNNAIMTMAYGLQRDAKNRSLSSEQKGVALFSGIYNRKPISASDWDIVRAITYSGATR